MSTTPTLTQVVFRIRTDTDLVGNTPTWAAAEGAHVSIAVETTFRIRFKVNNSGTGSGTGPYVIRVSKNAAAYTAVTTSTGATLGAQSADASSSTDEALVGAERLSGAAITFQGNYDESGSTNVVVPVSGTCEFEFGLILKTAGAAPGDTFDFRLYNSTTAFTTYSQVPRITVSETSGTDFQPKYDPLSPTVSFFEYLAAGHASTTQTMSRAVGVSDLHVVFYAVDNVATTDGDEAAVTSITDTAGNTYTKAAEWTKSGGALQGGVTAGIWYSQITSALSASNSLTINWSSSTNRDAVAWGARAYTVAGGKTVSVEATATGVATASATVPSLNPTTANIECLRFRINGVESNINQGFYSLDGARRTAGWSATLSQTANSGTAATSIAVVSESLISTGTSGASSPSALSAACDQVGVYVAFKAGLPNHACLANDVSSGSSVSQPAVVHGGPARLLDLYPAASFAYSFRKLRAFYTGSAVRILRASDSAELDVGFDSSGNFDTAAAAAHIGGSTGRIIAWYDQSGNGWHVTQPSPPLTYAPLYSATGLNSLPTVDFNGGSGEGLINTAFPANALPALTTTVMAVLLDQTSGQTGTLLGWNTGSITNRVVVHAAYANTIYFDYGDITYGSGRLYVGVPAGWNTGGHLLEVGREVTTNNQFIAVDGTALANFVMTALPSGGATTAQFTLGEDSTGANAFNGLVSELVMWAADLAANRTAARTNVQTYWLTAANNACLANDVASASSVTSPAVQQQQTLLANDVLSPSSVTKPTQLRQLQALLANDVKSTSTVSIPAATIRRDVLANDVLSPSSVKQATALINRGALANDVLSPSSVTQPSVHQTGGLLANDVLSTSSVSSPTLAIVAGGGVDACTANDIVSLSSLTQPQVHQAQSLLANDVISASSVTRPAVKQLQAILANDVTSPSSVSQPSAVIRRDVLANDVVSPSKVTNPLAVIGRTILANDVVSPSSVSQPLAVIQRAILANDVVSPSKVGNPIVGIVGVIDARDITSASSVTQPALKSLHGLLANDVKSPSSVSQPVALIVRNLLANDVTSPSSVTKPVVGEITAGQPLANDVISRSSVSVPTLVVVGQPPITVPPIVPPAHGGGAGYIGAKAKERLAELVEVAYRRALKIEPEVAKVIREAVKETIPDLKAQRLRLKDFERLAEDAGRMRSLLERVERISEAVKIQTALDALIAYEIALEEDDAEALLIAA